MPPALGSGRRRGEGPRPHGRNTGACRSAGVSPSADARGRQGAPGRRRGGSRRGRHARLPDSLSLDRRPGEADESTERQLRRRDAPEAPRRPRARPRGDRRRSLGGPRGPPGTRGAARRCPARRRLRPLELRPPDGAGRRRHPGHGVERPRVPAAVRELAAACGRERHARRTVCARLQPAASFVRRPGQPTAPRASRASSERDTSSPCSRTELRSHGSPRDRARTDSCRFWRAARASSRGASGRRPRPGQERRPSPPSRASIPVLPRRRGLSSCPTRS